LPSRVASGARNDGISIYISLGKAKTNHACRGWEILRLIAAVQCFNWIGFADYEIALL